MIRVLLSLGATLCLASCTIVSEGEYNNLHTTISGSPAMKREVIADCIRQKSAQSLQERKSDADFFNITLAKLPSTYCNRLFNAVASGRITYADYVKLGSSRADSSKVIRIMQGR